MTINPAVAGAFAAFDFKHGCWIGSAAPGYAMVMQTELRRFDIETTLEISGQRSSAGKEVRLYCKEAREYFWPVRELPVEAEFERLDAALARHDR